MHHYPEDQSSENLKKIRRDNVCSECDRNLVEYLDLKTHKVYIACSGGVHQGITREYQPPIEDYESNIRREIKLEQEHGRETSRALASIPKQGQLTKIDAMSVLRLVFPKAPDNEIERTAIFCHDFGLHPLAKEVFLIPYGNTWSMVVGIPANRKIAHAQKGEFSFLDDTPRAATEEEVIKQYGKDSEEAKDNIISITLLEGVGGNKAVGFGLYSKTTKVQGTDKGNSRRNMCNIHSERQAMDRLPGKPMPKDYEVIDAKYTVIPEVGKVNTGTGEIIEGEATEIPPEPAPEPTESTPAPVAVESKAEPPTDSPIDLDWLKESAKSIKWTEKTLTSWIAAKFKVKGGLLGDVVAELSPEQCKDLAKEMQDRLSMA